MENFLYQGSYQKHSKSFSVSPEKSTHLLVFVQNGNGTYRFGNQIREFSPYDLLLFYPDELISFSVNIFSNYEAFHLTFSSELLMDTIHEYQAGQLLQNFLFHTPSHIQLTLSQAQSSCLHHYFQILLFGQKDQLSWSGQIQAPVLASLLLYLARTSQYQIISGKPKKHELHQHQMQIEKVKHFIRSNLTEELNLQMISDHVYMNPSYLSRLFKEVTGVSVTRYIQKKRIAYAQMLLRDTEDLIVDIAAECGFNFTANFNQVFKKLTGMSPGAYRKQVKENFPGD